jgi:MFS family permease
MKNKALKILYFYNGIFVLAGSLLGPLYAIYVERFQGGILPVSISWSAFLLSTTFFIFLLSKYGDGVKEQEYLLMAGYLVRALVWLMYIFIGNITTLVIMQIFLGLGEALGSPSFDAIFAEHLDRGRHIKEYSDWKLISNIVLAMGTLAGGFIVSKFGFIPLFIIMSGLAFISFFGILLKPRKLL